MDEIASQTEFQNNLQTNSYIVNHSRFMNSSNIAGGQTELWNNVQTKCHIEEITHVSRTLQILQAAKLKKLQAERTAVKLQQQLLQKLAEEDAKKYPVCF